MRLKTLQKRLENIFELLNLWQQYVEVIYMPEAEVNLIEHLGKMEGRMPEDSYSRMLENDDVSKRLKMLFKPEDGGKVDNQDELDRAYETVNEGETTDTTSGVDDEALVASTRRMDTGAAQQASAAVDAPAKAVEEGIKSSDEEEEVAAEPEVAPRTTVEESAAATAAPVEESAAPRRDLNEQVVSFGSDQTGSAFLDGKERE